MTRGRILAVVAAVAIALLAYVVLERRDDRASPSDGAGAATGGTSTRGPAPRRDPRLPAEPVAPGTDAGAITATPFQMARGRAMTSLQNELIQRLHACVPPSDRPLRPQPIRLVFERRAEASNPAMQQYLAREVMLLGGNSESLTPEVKACVDQLRGMPVAVFASIDSLPTGDPTIDETFEIPLP